MDDFMGVGLIKMVRDLMPILVLMLLLVSGIEGFFIAHNSATVDALQAQNQLLATANAQTSQQFQTFLQQFTSEANYECMIASIRASEDNLPAPKPGTCTVTAP